MGISPVQAFGSVGGVQSTHANPAAGQSEPSGGSGSAGRNSVQPDVGPVPAQDNVSLRNVSASTELPQDEVQVQRDAQITDQIVVKYLVKATGELILQVPSAQVLDVARGIYQDFEQQAKIQETADASQAASEGGKAYGH